MCAVVDICIMRKFMNLYLALRALGRTRPSHIRVERWLLCGGRHRQQPLFLQNLRQLQCAMDRRWATGVATAKMRETVTEGQSITCKLDLGRIQAKPLALSAAAADAAAAAAAAAVIVDNLAFFCFCCCCCLSLSTSCFDLWRGGASGS